MQAGGVNDAIQYEADESCPPLIALGVGLQGVMLGVAPLVLIVAITAAAGGQDDSYLRWAVFAALIIAGVLTAVQATRFRRLGAGHIMIMGTTPNFVAVSALALAGGGPALLASLIVVASLFYLALAIWLPLLRRVITPVVSGTVLMVLAVTLVPIALDRVQEVPGDVPGAAGPTAALLTLAVATVMALRASGTWRLWSPLIAIAAGTVVAALFGAYDPQAVLDAPWAGIPGGSEFPGFDFTPGAEFWSLLPVFVVIVLVGGVKNIGDSVAMQGASRRRPRVTDFRLVQGSLNTNGFGIFFSGLAGTPPTSVFSSTSVSLVTMTGVASRNVGYVIGGAFLVLALFPKLPALVLTIPNPVMGAFLLTAIALIFVGGVRTVIQDGLDAKKMLVVGIAFSLGAGMEHQTIFEDLIGGTWGRQLDNGLLIGALAAVVMTVFLDLTSPRTGGRLQSKLHTDSLPEIDAFVGAVAGRLGWNEDSTQRLRSAAEETVLSLLPAEDETEAEDAPRLIVAAHPETGTVEMEFMAVFDEENLEDRLAYLEEEAEGLQEGEISLRLLRHYASSVHHQKYYGLDIVTVQVKGSR